LNGELKIRFSAILQELILLFSGYDADHVEVSGNPIILYQNITK